ncbi:hypothetical protein V8E53_009896 [Lactarius tabidus]
MGRACTSTSLKRIDANEKMMVFERLPNAHFMRGRYALFSQFTCSTSSSFWSRTLHTARAGHCATSTVRWVPGMACRDRPLPAGPGRARARIGAGSCTKTKPYSSSDWLAGAPPKVCLCHTIILPQEISKHQLEQRQGRDAPEKRRDGRAASLTREKSQQGRAKKRTAAVASSARRSAAYGDDDCSRILKWTPLCYSLYVRLYSFIADSKGYWFDFLPSDWL